MNAGCREPRSVLPNGVPEVVMSAKTNEALQDYLIRGSDYLKQYPDFKLVGREQEVRQLTAILTRSHANCVLLVGPGGVGGSALCLGLEEAKSRLDAPFDLISKRFYWLDSDGLFSSGDSARINDSFQKTIRTLARTPDSVLIVDDIRDFIDAARSNATPHLINALMRGVKQKETQVIFESRDEDLDVVLRAHSDMREYYTLLDVREPAGEMLEAIVTTTARQRLERHHQIRISDGAIQTALELTSKYRVRDLGLSRAQPERSLTLLDRALTSYRLDAHSQDPRLETLKVELDQARAEFEMAEGERRAELEALCSVKAQEIETITAAWKVQQQQIKQLYHELRKGEEAVRRLEVELEAQLVKEAETREHAANRSEPTASAAAVNRFMLGSVNIDSSEVVALKEKISRYLTLIEERKSQFDELTGSINDLLELDSVHVLSEFSTISGIPVNKLTQDERKKLLNLDENLGKRVFGQQEAIGKLANQVRVAKAGLQALNKPQAAFLFLGPSGVGKTEIAKALTAELFDDEGALLRFDMSEYMEKHAVAKLIGAPPGYEGYEAGGILTNELRRNPRRIILFDEIEKAHPDVFNVFLQILDDARLTDNRGLTVSFRDTVILMTTNIGTLHFLRESDFAIAQELALEELDEVYRPEFLNRFNGRQNIVCFEPLNLSVIERIARREISRLNQMVQSNMPGLEVTIDDAALVHLCRDHYKPVNGARGITGYIEGVIKPEIANTVLFDSDASGVIEIGYDSESKSALIGAPQNVSSEALSV
jgi:ATP-dependent Clp protease ATP-binding subunit ClpB